MTWVHWLILAAFVLCLVGFCLVWTRR